MTTQNEIIMAKRGRPLGSRSKTHKYDDPPTRMVCPGCGRDLEAKMFTSAPSSPSGLYCYCRECAARAMRRHKWLRRIKQDGAAAFLAEASHQADMATEMFKLLREYNASLMNGDQDE